MPKSQSFVEGYSAYMYGWERIQDNGRDPNTVYFVCPHPDDSEYVEGWDEAHYDLTQK